jgi:hypothetical protein
MIRGFLLAIIYVMREKDGAATFWRLEGWPWYYMPTGWFGKTVGAREEIPLLWRLCDPWTRAGQLQ